MKTNLTFIVCLLTALLSFNSCTPVQDEKYTLSADKTSVGADEEVTFTVTSSQGEDVTAAWCLSDDTGIREGRRFGWSEPGTYTVCAALGTNPSLKAANTVTVTVSPSATTYRISCDKTEVKVNEEVTFTVTSSTGEDVSASWNFCDESMCRIGNRFGWSEPGTHTVTAHSQENPNLEAENTVTVKVTGSVYKLYADKQIVYVLDEVNFHVKEVVDGVEQEKESTGFVAGIRGGEQFALFGPMTNVFAQAGNYMIEAVKYDFAGKEIARAENTLEIIVRERSAIDYEDRYFRRSLVAEGSGTNCTTCPMMARAIEYAQTYLLPDRMVPISFHLNDDACNVPVPIYRHFFILNNDYALHAYPFYIVDWNASYSSVNSKTEELKNKVEASQARYSHTPGLAAETALSGRDLTVKIRTTPREAAEYLLGVYIVEDNIHTKQAGADNGMMMQQDVAYYCLTAQDAPEEERPEEGIGQYGQIGVTPLGRLEERTEYTYDYRFTLPTRTPDDHDLSECRLVYFICQVDEATEPYGYFCANAATCRLGESQDYEFEPIYEE